MSGRTDAGQREPNRAPLQCVAAWRAPSEWGGAHWIAVLACGHEVLHLGYPGVTRKRCRACEGAAR